jgi:hypothetical protein
LSVTLQILRGEANVGLAPTNYLEVVAFDGDTNGFHPGDTAKALFDYDAGDPDEIDFEEGVGGQIWRSV